MDEEVFIEGAIHSNKITPGFDIFDEENKHVLENLIMTIEGSIIGVKSAVVLPHLQDPEVRKMRVGAVKMPSKFKVENEDDLYRLLALMVPLDEYY
jgi:hypothetical protein